MVALGNPVRGHIYAKGEAHAAGAFAVVRTFADHVAAGAGGGIDIGDGKCGSDILTMGRFRVTEAFTISSGPYVGAKVVRYALLDYPGYEAGLAHMPSIETAVGVTGPEGSVIGHIGNSGGVPCHLHGGMKLNGVEIDWWNLLRQNGATDGGDMIPIPSANYKRLANKKTTLVTAGNFRTERKSGTILKLFPAGTVFYPVAYANDGDVPAGSQSGEWFYGILLDDSPAGYIGGWFHSSLLGPLVDDVPTTGHSDAELIDAVSKAGHNAAVDVSAVGQKALADAAAKYP